MDRACLHVVSRGVTFGWDTMIGEQVAAADGRKSASTGAADAEPRRMKQRWRTVVLVVGAFAALCAANLIAFALTAPRIICRLYDARQTKAKADITALVYALETFRIERGAIPTTAEGLAPLVNAASEAYLWKIPIDPWGRSYQYVSDGHRYSIASLGADGKRGGDGKDSDIDDSSAFGNAPDKPPTRAAQPSENGSRRRAARGLAR